MSHLKNSLLVVMAALALVVGAGLASPVAFHNLGSLPTAMPPFIPGDGK
jgi:hypothetical protein